MTLNAYALRDPFAPSVNSSLTSYPVTQLSMVGTINKNNELWAIVRTPDDKVYPVTVGSAIGSDQGKVLQVTNQQVTIQQGLNDQNVQSTQVTTLMLAQTP